MKQAIINAVQFLDSLGYEEGGAIVEDLMQAVSTAEMVHGFLALISVGDTVINSPNQVRGAAKRILRDIDTHDSDCGLL